jgi:Flp pilus assembly protein TadB
MTREDFGSKIYSSNQIKKMDKKIKLLGINTKYTAIKMLNIRLISSIILFFVLLYILDFGYLIAPIVTILYYFSFVPLFIDSAISKRRRKLEKEALYFFEILALSLDAGRNIKVSLEVTCKNVDSEISDEFKKVLSDVRFGKNLNDALNDLKYRIPSDTINNIVLNIRQSNIFGNDVVETVHSQIEYIREKRILETKGEISKMPVKISIVSVLFFIPIMLLLLLAPVLLKLWPELTGIIK